MKKSRLPKIRVAITNKCQLMCVFCGGSKSHMENFQPKKMTNIMEYFQLIEILKIYVQCGGVYVQITGGEPLLYDGINNLIKDICAMGGIPEINTNGLALTKEKAIELSKAGLKVLKISIPSFIKENYFRITGVDGLEKVLNNAHIASEFLDVRINTVAMKSNINEVEIAINMCRKYGLKQLLYLELLYYHDLHGNSKYFFSNEYCNVFDKLGTRIEKIIKSKFKKYEFYNEFGNELLVCTSSIDGFQVFIKQSNRTLRAEICKKCRNYCQEGIYELRLSTGGYISFCNTVNELGKNISRATRKEIEKVFNSYIIFLEDTYYSSFKDFLKINDIEVKYND